VTTRHRCAGVVLVLVLGPARLSSGNTDTALLDKAVQLNRTGKWMQAAELLEAYLGQTPRPSSQRCQALLSAAYARLRLKQYDAARAHLRRFEAERAGVTLPAWYAEQYAKMTRELSDAPATKTTPRPSNPWPKADPSSLGLNPDAVREHQALCQRTGADSCLVVCRGRVVSEWYSQRYRAPIHAMSSTKSIASLLVGILLKERKIASLDERVSTYLPEYKEGRKRKVTIRHLLSHTAGFRKYTDDGVGYVADKNAFVRKMPVDYEPGTRFAYSNEGVQLLSPILDKAAGEPIQQYARKKLFEPLGMSQSRLNVDGAGHAWTYADMLTTPRDFAKIGQLMINKGKWKGTQIVDEAYIREATRPSQRFNTRCGLLWWVYSGGPDILKGFATKGYLNTDLYVFPREELIVVRTQSPKTVYTGARESAGYERRALRLFKQMCGG